jgi:hypothetical protein
MKKIYLFILFLFFFYIFPSSVSAQTQAKLESCFDYYAYGKVAVNLSPDKSSYSPGETAHLKGTIINRNTFPLLDTVIYAYLKRVNNDNTSFLQNGHYLIQGITLKKELNFLPNESKWVELELPISQNYPNGEYQLQYFIFSKYGFHYSGRPFLEEDFAGLSNFQINNSSDPTIYFDPSSLRVNNTNHTIRESVVEYDKLPITFEVSLAKNAVFTQPLNVKIALYSFEETFEENKVSSLAAQLQPNQKTVTTTLNPTNPGAYVVVFEIDSPAKTMLKYRFAVKGTQADSLRMNDLGITFYPPDINKDRAYVCFHSPSIHDTPETKVTLSLLDSAKTTLDSVYLQQVFTPDIYAISVPLKKLTNTADFWIKAEFTQPGNPQAARSVETHYSKESFPQNLKDIDVSFDQKQNKLLILTKNAFGENIDDSINIESIKIYDDNNKLVVEEYNFKSNPNGLSLDQLNPGTYKAVIKVDKLEKDLSFNVIKSKGKPQVIGKSTGIYLLGAFLMIVIIGICLLIYFFFKKKQDEKTI